MNIRMIKKYCLANNIHLYYNKEDLVYLVKQNDVTLYQSIEYEDCLDYITEVIINDKHTNNR